MARNFDFDKYKSIVDYIQVTTGGISTSIDNLIKGSIELRSKSVASIVKYSTSIKEVVIGRMSSAIGTETWSTPGAISLDITQGGRISFEEDYKYDPDSMLPSSINQNIITQIGTKFVKKSSGTIVLQREYDPTVTTFGDNDIPSVGFFKTNYVTSEDGIVFGKIILASDSKNNHKSAVNKIIADKIAGTSKVNNKIESYSRKVLSNLFDVLDDGTVSLSSSPDTLTIGAGVVLHSAPSEKSLITSNNIESAVIRKDLSNLTPCIMLSEGTDVENVQTDDDALMSILSVGTMTADVATIPSSCQPTYFTDLIHPSIEDDSDAIKDKYSILKMERYLSLDKDDFAPDLISSMYTRLFALTPVGFNSSTDDVANARGNMATTLKMVYEMVATRLLLANRELFIDNVEYLNQQSITSLLLRPTSAPEFNRRPMALSPTNDAALVSDLKERILELNATSSGGKVRSW